MKATPQANPEWERDYGKILYDLVDRFTQKNSSTKRKSDGIPDDNPAEGQNEVRRVGDFGESHWWNGIRRYFGSFNVRKLWSNLNRVRRSLSQ